MLAFQEQLYKCMLGQALQMKGSMELHRATNQFGTMIWYAAIIGKLLWDAAFTSGADFTCWVAGS
jgi:hypothetical protein